MATLVLRVVYNDIVTDPNFLKMMTSTYGFDVNMFQNDVCDRF